MSTALLKKLQIYEAYKDNERVLKEKERQMMRSWGEHRDNACHELEDTTDDQSSNEGTIGDDEEGSTGGQLCSLRQELRQAHNERNYFRTLKSHHENQIQSLREENSGLLSSIQKHAKTSREALNAVSTQGNKLAAALVQTRTELKELRASFAENKVHFERARRLLEENNVSATQTILSLEGEISRLKEERNQLQQRQINLLSVESKLSAAAMCRVCLSYMHDPKMLGCGHIFCGRCLYHWKDIHGPHWGGMHSCPLCRQEDYIIEGGSRVVKELYSSVAYNHPIVLDEEESVHSESGDEYASLTDGEGEDTLQVFV